MATKEEDALALAHAVLAWWAEHQFDTIALGEGEEDNVYDEAPACVALARTYLEHHSDPG